MVMTPKLLIAGGFLLLTGAVTLLIRHRLRSRWEFEELVYSLGMIQVYIGSAAILLVPATAFGYGMLAGALVAGITIVAIAAIYHIFVVCERWTDWQHHKARLRGEGGV